MRIAHATHCKRHGDELVERRRVFGEPIRDCPTCVRLACERFHVERERWRRRGYVRKLRKGLVSMVWP